MKSSSVFWIRFLNISAHDGSKLNYSISITGGKWNFIIRDTRNLKLKNVSRVRNYSPIKFQHKRDSHCGTRKRSNVKAALGIECIAWKRKDNRFGGMFTRPRNRVFLILFVNQGIGPVLYSPPILFILLVTKCVHRGAASVSPILSINIIDKS